jgi:hypothetical protein
MTRADVGVALALALLALLCVALGAAGGIEGLLR